MHDEEIRAVPRLPHFAKDTGILGVRNVVGRGFELNGERPDGVGIAFVHPLESVGARNAIEGFIDSRIGYVGIDEEVVLQVSR